MGHQTGRIQQVFCGGRKIWWRLIFRRCVIWVIGCGPCSRIIRVSLNLHRYSSPNLINWSRIPPTCKYKFGAQVKGLQLSLNKLASKDELAAVQHDADVRIGEVEHCLDATHQEMESRCQRMDESIHDLNEQVIFFERKQSAAVRQVPDARSDSRSVRQPVSLGVSNYIDMYHIPVGMGEFPRPVLHSTMRKVAAGAPISVSTHFTPISSMLDLGSGLGAHMHPGTPVAAVDVSGGAFGSVSNGVYHPFLPTGAAPALGVAPSVSITTANAPCSVPHTHSAVLPTIQPGVIMAPSLSSNTTCANSADQSSHFNNSRNTSVSVKEPSVKMPSFDA